MTPATDRKFSHEASAAPVSVPLVSVVVIDDDADILNLIHEGFEGSNLRVFTATCSEAGLALVQEHRPAAVLVDLRLPGIGGMAVLEAVLEFDPTIAVLVITGDASVDTAVEAMRRGAVDYLQKPFSVEAVKARLLHLLAPAPPPHSGFCGMIGNSPKMRALFADIRRFAGAASTVLIKGATGSGKELVARALHELCVARKGPLVVCNAAAVVESLAESELFGYVRGAFTGAHQDRIGLFEFASGGTLFLDEIGELSPLTQAKLLRVLQTQEVQRVGSPVSRKVDVRVIAASNRDLRHEVSQRRFREDLFYRLAIVELQVPALSERAEDILPLALHFLGEFSRQYQKRIRGLSRAVQRILTRYPWPGNVRELENVIGSACLRADGAMIEVADLPAGFGHAAKAPSGHALMSAGDAKREHARRVLVAVGGNKRRAADILGISRATLYNWFSRSELACDPPEPSAAPLRGSSY